jgi:hypothetical protein
MECDLACPDVRRHDVERPLGESTAMCPFLHPVNRDDEVTYPHGFSCRLRRGPLRAPSVDELAWFCTSGRHHVCPTYRRSRQTGGEQ